MWLIVLPAQDTASNAPLRNGRLQASETIQTSAPSFRLATRTRPALMSIPAVSQPAARNCCVCWPLPQPMSRTRAPSGSAGMKRRVIRSLILPNR